MNLPFSFSDDMRSLLGEKEFLELRTALEQEPVASIRLNDAKYSVDRERASSDGLQPIPWCREGFYLEERFTYTFDPLFHAGCYYVQEASSMVLGEVIRQQIHEPVVALDLCAAPGGKTTHLLQALSADSLVVANEVNQARVRTLTDNLLRWGQPNVVVTRNDPADFTGLSALFDVIVVDAPCSGEGMFRKDRVAVEEWSPEHVELCYKRQRRILSDVWQALKPGGLLIYSTCTYNVRENEENVKWMCEEWEARPVELVVPREWNITGDLTGSDLPVYRFFPSRTRGEGFFIAAVRKGGSLSEEPDLSLTFSGKKGKKKTRKNKTTSQGTGAARSFMEKAGQWCKLSGMEYIPVEAGDSFGLFPAGYAELLNYLEDKLHILQRGTPVGEWKGRDWIPCSFLPFSILVDTAAFPVYETTYEQALTYLRKEAFPLPGHLPAGYVLVCYRNVPLGFMKNIGNRANNLYPAEFRIRSSYLPEQIRTL
ncbi:MAG: rRNA cytosine-C5-methyltransferase [Bacteroides sp.]|nr:rRNA cytosine-C5-methyltransferase [Bacteroides sp.]